MTSIYILISKGWKLIGKKRHKYGMMDCWVPPQDSPAADDPRAYWTQGDAISWQRQYDQAGIKPEPVDGIDYRSPDEVLREIEKKRGYLQRRG